MVETVVYLLARVEVRPVGQSRVCFGRQHPGGFGLKFGLLACCRPERESIPRRHSFRTGFLVVSVGEGRRSACPRMSGVRVEYPTLWEVAVVTRGGDVGGEQVNDGRPLRDERGVVGGEHPRRVQEVPVVEVVVVELVRTEGWRQADYATSLVVVDEAALVPDGAALGVGPVVHRQHELVLDVGSDVVSPDLARDIEHVGESVHPFAAVVGVCRRGQSRGGIDFQLFPKPVQVLARQDRQIERARRRDRRDTPRQRADRAGPEIAVYAFPGTRFAVHAVAGCGVLVRHCRDDGR